VTFYFNVLSFHAFFTDAFCSKDKTILIPLTSSLYLPGKLKDAENVIVDVGTGYYVKKVGNRVCGIMTLIEPRTFQRSERKR
jgi:Prefoldin subunit